MKKLLIILLLACLQIRAGAVMPPVKTVFVIVFENFSWAFIEGNINLPYVNFTLLPRASSCEQYFNPPGNHPSLPNYIWLEAGTNFGILNGGNPFLNHQASTNHLVTLLNRAGISWKTYQEDIDGSEVPLTGTNSYAPRHNPFVYFDDVTGTNNPDYSYGIAHIRPYSELAGDLTNNTVARYNFITPNLCNDGHDSCPPLNSPLQQVDQWLASEIPQILNSAAYSNNGALFITWDEGFNNSDNAVGMIVLSPLARGGGYANYIRYTHSSTLRSLQEIFGVTPLLGDAANAPDLGDLFAPLAISSVARLTNGACQLWVSGVIRGRTNIIQAAPNLAGGWAPISTNVVATNSFSVIDTGASSRASRFYRALQLP